MKLMMHICCAPCSIYPLTVIKERGIEVKCLWFNPNIHPYTEYKNRLGALQKLKTLCDAQDSDASVTPLLRNGLEIEYIDHYGLKEYLKDIAGNEENRCEYCYLARLEKTAQKAKEINADAFTTSLLVSPYQKFGIIKEMGRMLQYKYSVEFYFSDFRIGFRDGRKISKELGLYQQKYCGCIFSEMERHSARGL